MTQGKLIRVIGYYIDASYIERIIATFRKLLIDIDWVYGRRINEEGLYELYLIVRDHPNFMHAVLNLSKTVNIEKVEIFNSYSTKVININNIEPRNINISNKNTFILYIPIYSEAITYSWGEKYGENIS